jgi:TonB family protein
MRYPVCLRIALCLTLSSLAFSHGGAASTAQSEETLASDSSTQGPKQLRSPMVGLGGIDLLSDPMGVDFGPYLQRAVKTVKQNWYHISPPSARAPKMMRGAVSIEFAILKTGKIAGMKRIESSGDVSMDKAAWQGITDSRFPPLPSEFPGQYLALRFHFVYNPAKPSDTILQYRE